MRGGDAECTDLRLHCNASTNVLPNLIMLIRELTVEASKEDAIKKVLHM